MPFTSRLTSRRSQPPLALAVPLSRFTSRVGGGSAFFVRPMSMTISDWTSYVLVEAARWLNTVVYLLGLCIAVWAFRRSRKRAYLVVGAYFALILFASHVWPPITHAIYVYRTPIEVQQRDEEQARARRSEVPRVDAE